MVRVWAGEDVPGNLRLQRLHSCARHPIRKFTRNYDASHLSVTCQIILDPAHIGLDLATDLTVSFPSFQLDHYEVLVARP